MLVSFLDWKYVSVKENLGNTEKIKEETAQKPVILPSRNSFQKDWYAYYWYFLWIDKILK